MAALWQGGKDDLRAHEIKLDVLARLHHRAHEACFIAAADAVQQGKDASRELPAASRLTDALADLCVRAPEIDVDSLADEDWVEGSLPITRVEAGRLWLAERGPLTVPKRVTDTVPLGWEVWVVMVRRGGRWHLLESGFVYP